jgi:hypothetical protein
MTSWRKAVELIVTVVVVGAMTVVLLGVFLVEGRPETRNVAIGIVLFFGAVSKGGAIALLRRRDLKYRQAAEDPAATLRLSRPKSDDRALLGWFSVATAGCVFMLLGGKESPFGWLAPSVLLAIFGTALVMGFVALWRGQRVSLQLSPQGLDYSRFGTGPIAWPDIRAAKLTKLFKTKVITLKLHDEAKYLQRSARLARNVGCIRCFAEVNHAGNRNASSQLRAPERRDAYQYRVKETQ